METPKKDLYTKVYFFVVNANKAMMIDAFPSSAAGAEGVAGRFLKVMCVWKFNHCFKSVQFLRARVKSLKSTCRSCRTCRSCSFVIVPEDTGGQMDGLDRWF